MLSLEEILEKIENKKDYGKIEGNIRKQVLAGILKVRKHLCQVLMAMGNHWEINKVMIRQSSSK